MSAGSIVIDLLLKTGSFETDTKRAEQAAKKFGKEIDAIASKVGTTLAVGFAAASAAAIYLGKTQLEAADQMGKLAQQAGTTVEEFSALAYAADLAGISKEELSASLVKLTKNMSEAAQGTGEAVDGFKALNISVKNTDGTLRSSDAVLGDLAERFAGMKDSAEKTALAVNIFGRSGAQLIPLLNAGRAGIKELKDEAQRLGVVISGETAKAAEEFNDNMTRLKKSAEGLALTFVKELLPTLQSITDQLLIGQKNAKGFFDSILTFGTINPFKSIGDNITSYSNMLEEAKASQTELQRLGLSTPASDKAYAARIDDLTKKLAYLRELQAKDAMAGAGDNQSSAEARRLGLGGGLSTAPVLVDSKKLAEELKKLREKDIDGWVKYADAVLEEGERIEEGLRKIQEERNAENEKARKVEMEQYLDFIDQQTEEYEDALRKQGEALDKSREKTKQVGAEISIIFTSAFEDAVVAGKDFSSVLEGLGQDVLRLVVRMLILKPLLDSIKSSMENGSAAKAIAKIFNSGGDATVTPQANGGIMTSSGPMSLNAYAGGGVATSPQVALFGEGSMNEAFVPLPDGRSIPVSLNGGGGSNVVVQVIESKEKAGTTERTSGNSGDVIKVFVARVKADIGNDFASGGSLAGVLERQYGLNRTIGG